MGRWVGASTHLLDERRQDADGIHSWQQLRHDAVEVGQVAGVESVEEDVFGGAARALLPAERLAGFGLKWVTAVPAPLLKAIGVLEVLGGLGLVLPVLTGVMPVLTPIAACGLAVIMLGGLVFHLHRREWQGVPITLVLAAAIFVAVARFAGV